VHRDGKPRLCSLIALCKCPLQRRLGSSCTRIIQPLPGVVFSNVPKSVRRDPSDNKFLECAVSGKHASSSQETRTFCRWAGTAKSSSKHPLSFLERIPRCGSDSHCRTHRRTAAMTSNAEQQKYTLKPNGITGECAGPFLFEAIRHAEDALIWFFVKSRDCTSRRGCTKAESSSLDGSAFLLRLRIEHDIAAQLQEVRFPFQQNG
jgi:hypothetical protein